jgi:hypothetical protein
MSSPKILGQFITACARTDYLIRDDISQTYGTDS